MDSPKAAQAVGCYVTHCHWASFGDTFLYLPAVRIIIKGWGQRSHVQLRLHPHLFSILAAWQFRQPCKLEVTFAVFCVCKYLSHIKLTEDFRFHFNWVTLQVYSPLWLCKRQSLFIKFASKSSFLFTDF